METAIVRGAQRTGRARPRLVTAVLLSVAVTAGALASAPAAEAVTGVSSWGALQSAMSAGGDIQLLGPITGGGGQYLAVGAGVSVSLDLNGYALSIPTPPGGYPAIQVPGTTSLTVGDTSSGAAGTLDAHGGFGAAGIGGMRFGADFGSITITGGTVSAQGGQYGAGIGSGENGVVSGTIAITGGTVSAQGTSYSAAIGGGFYSGGSLAVTIGTGATVTATSSYNAIGAGLASYVSGSLTNAGTVILPSSTVLQAPSIWAFTNNGTVQNAGWITGSGPIANAGTILNTGTIDPATAITGYNYSVQLAPLAGTVSPTSLQVYADTLTAGSVTLPSAIPSTSGQVFTGWNTLADGSGTTIAASSSLSGAAGLSTGAAVVLPLFATYNAVPVISTTSLAAGTVGTAYTAGIGTSAGSGITYSVSSGTLPPGLSLNASTGQISGTPTTAGTSSVTVTATNSLGSGATTFSITIGAAPVVVVPTPPVTPIASPSPTPSPVVAPAPQPTVEPLRIVVVRSNPDGSPYLAGSTILVSVSGLVVGEHYSILIGGRTVGSGVADAASVLRRVRVPSTVGDTVHRLRVFGSAHRTSSGTSAPGLVMIRTAAKAKHLLLTVAPTPQVEANRTVQITVRGLYAGEPVTVTYEGTRVSAKRDVASASGEYTLTVSAGWSWGWKTIHVHGVNASRQQSAEIAVVARR